MTAVADRVRATAFMADGLCAQTDPELFYPEKGRSSLPARAICAECPVKTECLEYAMATDQPHGVWGGMTRQARNKLRGRKGNS